MAGIREISSLYIGSGIGVGRCISLSTQCREECFNCQYTILHGSRILNPWCLIQASGFWPQDPISRILHLGSSPCILDAEPSIPNPAFWLHWSPQAHAHCSRTGLVCIKYALCGLVTVSRNSALSSISLTLSRTACPLFQTVVCTSCIPIW